jgi:capsid protein
MSRAPVLYDGRGRAITGGLSRRGYVPGGFLAAGNSRRRSWLPGMLTDGHREYGTQPRRETQRKARFMKKNVGLVRGVAKSLIDHAIGPGVFPLPSTKNEAWNELAWNWFWELAKICEVSGTMTLWEVQRDRTDAKFYDGEKFTLHVQSTKGWPQLQLIRSHNCGNYGVDEADGWIDGVQVDSVLRRRAFRFRLRGDDNYVTVPARSVVHSYMLEDSDDVRGKTALMHAIDSLNDMLDSLLLEMDALKDNSRVSRVIKTESGEDEDDIKNRLTGGSGDGEDDADDGTGLKLEAIFGAEIVRLKKDEELTSFASSRPSPTFTGFLDWLGKLVTNGCGFPYEFAWNPNDLKGPGVRLVLEKVRLAVEEWRRNEIQDTYPFYTYAISTAMDLGELPYNPEWFKCEWIGGAPDVTIDKGRDAQQDRDNIKAALDTFKRYYARQGLWWKTELRQKAKEAAFIAELAEEYGIDPDRIHLLLQQAAAQPAANDQNSSRGGKKKTDTSEEDMGDTAED